MGFILVRDPGLTAGGRVGALDGAQVVCASNKIRGTAIDKAAYGSHSWCNERGGGPGEFWIHYLKKGLISEISRWYWIVTMKSSPRTVTRYRISISSNILTRLIYRT